MPIRAEERKTELVEGLAALCGKRLKKAGERDALARFISRFYAHVPLDDVAARSTDELWGAAASLWRFAAERTPGKPKLRVFNPDQAADGWHSARTIVEIVNDDMPFLVDSVTAALNGLNSIVHLVIHPIVLVERDAKGRLVRLLDEPKGNGAALRESVMHVEIGEERDPKRLAAIAARLEAVLLDVRRAVQDWPAMRSALARVLDDLASNPPPLPAKELAEGVDFLRWLDEDNFTFLGYREYRFDGGAVARDAASSLGILKDETYSVFDGLRRFKELPPDIQEFLRQPRLLMIAKSNKRGTVHRSAHMDAIGVKMFGKNGAVVGERLFLGFFTSVAYSRSTRAIPLLRLKVQSTMARAGFAPSSHDGKALLHILDTYPRDELFQVGNDELFEIALGILNLQERQRIALFVRRDPFARFVSCLVYVPRDRYTTELRERIGRILEEAYAGTVAGFNTTLDESVLARIHFMVRTKRGSIPDIATEAVERRVVEAGRTWTDRLADALAAAEGEDGAPALIERYRRAFPTAYRERVAAPDAIADIAIVETVLAGIPLGMRLYRPAVGGERELGFKIVREGSPVALSDVLPMLENMGLRVIGETPHELAIAGGRIVWLHDFVLEAKGTGSLDIAAARPRFEEAFARIWAGGMENDGFNRLVLGAGLAWRQVVVLRTYCKILRQAGSAFSQAYMEDALSAHPLVAARLVGLFETRFDPAREKGRELRAIGLVQEIDHALDAVTNLDEDRILRSFLVLVQKSLRTNYFQPAPDGRPKSYLSIKLASHELDLLPAPRPLFEIFVYSPRTEGLHLRGGKVARGGIRWSDRKEDFRTEVLGLMKAQMVKNAVIVPVGSKGGFVVKRPPAARDQLQAEGIECYKILMRGLLDVTDNFVGDKVVPPSDVVRRDPDDPYLVVAADKGTATFSDIANSVAIDYGFWLGDAFASGGSVGYDHKAMGITARGAWETVKRHFRELGTDIQTTQFTCVGVGDMSGDVFGNGMLLSPATKLVGAFNHMHIFIDPDPDPATSLAERRRLFALPRSQWSDYNAKLISRGGGIFERSAKSIAPTQEMKRLFGIDADRATPAELIRAMLRARVDLLWFGGIGTYVKASSESQAEAGDRANDALRINGEEIRAKVVGEGANLGVTQRGRIEYALNGGRINTDAIDNSAGVDTSDHEVNLKILLNPVMRTPARNKLLAEMTDDVAELVLRDNYLQGLAISLAERQAPELLDRHLRLIRSLEKEGKLDRALEFLPDDETIAARAVARQGLTRPELAVLLAYAKNVLYAELLPSDLPDDPQLVTDLVRYFPRRLAKRYRGAMESHRLRREIIATYVTNSIVNRGGIAFVNEMKERTGAKPSEIARAYAVTREAFPLRTLWTAIEALDNKVASAVQYDMLIAAAGLAERATEWLLRSGLKLNDLQARIDQFRPGIETLGKMLEKLLPEAERGIFARRVDGLTGAGVPRALAESVAKLDWLVSGFDIVRLDETTKLDIVEVGRIYFAAGSRFGLDRLRDAARRLKADTPWQKMAVAALIDDFFALQSAFAAAIIGNGARKAQEALGSWQDGRKAQLAMFDAALSDMLAGPAPDMAVLAVASRQLRALAG